MYCSSYTNPNNKSSRYFMTKLEKALLLRQGNITSNHTVNITKFTNEPF